MHYQINDIVSVVKGVLISPLREAWVEAVTMDSRLPVLHANTLFIALKGKRYDAHDHLQDAWQKGVRLFIVEKKINTQAFPDALFILVSDGVKAFQAIAAFHRSHFNIPVIGITGSNGKTIVKEWLYQILDTHYQIVASPGSYNSQTGVPVSVLQLNDHHTLGIFEAGISRVNEMTALAEVIQPTIGIFTNLGNAHDEGFAGPEEKISEKWKLFRHAETVICAHDVTVRYPFIRHQHLFTWGKHSDADVQLLGLEKNAASTLISLQYSDDTGNPVHFQCEVLFTDEASIENVLHCITLLIYLHLPVAEIITELRKLRTIPMRMTVKKIHPNAQLIDDTYSADLASLKIALDYLSQFKNVSRRTVVLTDLQETGISPDKWTYAALQLLKQYGVDRFIGIGKEWLALQSGDRYNHLKEMCLFPDVPMATRYLQQEVQPGEVILLKGARVFALERMVHQLETHSHETRIEINLPALIRNVRLFRQHLQPGVKMMGMVKAFSYGTGAYEIASVLAEQGVDYLGVAYVDEGVALRQKGITLPIMVMNVEPGTYERLTAYQLEPALYSREVLMSFLDYLHESSYTDYPVHLELETGMHRLGMNQTDIESVLPLLNDQAIQIRSVFSHLAASENMAEDQYTLEQYEQFCIMSNLIRSVISYNYIEHILNTAGIIRHKNMQMGMVRLGIGMYGVAVPRSVVFPVEEVVSLITTIAQIKDIPAGATVSYGRKGIAANDMRIATVRIGYADGYPRALGNGRGYVAVNGNVVPVVGAVCMDMLMIDITGLSQVKVGDAVELWGSTLSVNKVAEWAGTIPYELLTGISDRVKRVYITG